MKFQFKFYFLYNCTMIFQLIIKIIAKKKIKLFFIPYFLLFFISGILQSQNIYTLAGVGLSSACSFTTEPAISAYISNPQGIALDKLGNIYISSCNVVRKINTNGIITVIAGTGNVGPLGDGGPAILATFFEIGDIVVDDSLNVFITDAMNNRIRKVSNSGIITTIAGTGNIGPLGDNGPATQATLDRPMGIAIDKKKNIYVSEMTGNRIRKITPSGIITTIAGVGGLGSCCGDGGYATNAGLNYPIGLSVDSLGNLFIADSQNRRIRKVDTLGIISTVAGNGTITYNGDGINATSASIYEPKGVDVDDSSNIYISEFNGQRIRKVNQNGIINTICGNGIGGYSGDGGLAKNAQVNFPYDVFIKNGKLYFSDYANNRIRIICSNNCLSDVQSIEKKKFQIKTYPMPSNGFFSLIGLVNVYGCRIEIFDSQGRLINTQLLKPSENLIELKNVNSGLYYINITSNFKQIGKAKIIIE